MHPWLGRCSGSLRDKKALPRAVVQTGCFIFSLVFVSSAIPSFIFVGSLQKVKHAWPHTQQGESKAFELNIQNSLLLLELSGLPNSDELSTMTETKTGEFKAH